MTTINKVALVGATGDLGAPVFEHVLNAGFQVTVLTRKGSSHTWPSKVTVKAVDYDSLDSLVDALQGQDAVVCTITTSAIPKQLLLIQAAVKAGVKRFIPSEFGSDTLNEKASHLLCYKDKVEVMGALKKAAAESSLTWTSVHCGVFLDWAIRADFLADVKNRTIELPDGGDGKTSSTTLATIGKVVVGVLRNPDQTKNRAVYVQEAAFSSKQLAEILKKYVGADGWTEKVTSIEEGVQKAIEKSKTEPDSFDVFLGSVKAAIWKEGYGGHFQKLDNELFGIKELAPAEFEDIVAKNIPK